MDRIFLSFIILLIFSNSIDNIKMFTNVVFFFFFSILVLPCCTQVPEPFPELHDYNKTGNPPRPLSPDPLVRYTWSAKTNLSKLQIYRVVDRPEKYDVKPACAVSGIEPLSLANNLTSKFEIAIEAEGTLMIDWGVERAAWFEFVSPDLNNSADGHTVTASVSEYNKPYPGKTKPLTKYGTTYRLETNDELYEGVRFTWIHFPSPSKPWHITSISLVAKVKPVNYTGSFTSSDDTLTESWYTGAYGVRLNMESDGFNSVLVERGDRVSIQGDGHPTMAASHVAFSPYNLVQDMLIQTNSGFVHGHKVVDQNIMQYPIDWTMSLNDWFMASGDIQGFLDLAPDAMSILDKRIEDFLEDPNLVWMGWDDRVGDGWCSPGSLEQGGCGREAQLTFAALVVRACNDLGRSLNLAGWEMDGQKYKTIAKSLGTVFRKVPEWPDGLGLHSAANVLNAGDLIATNSEIDSIFEKYLTDSVHVCSFSNFNQYWNLQGMGNANRMEHALASVKLCWGMKLGLGKGCFWENFSPYWAAWMTDGDKSPKGVSYCHPWASGVTAWLSHVVGGVRPLLPGYEEFVVTPYVSANYPHVDVVMPKPTGNIAVIADLQGHNETIMTSHTVLTMKVEVSTAGFVGVRVQITGSTEGSEGCPLDTGSVLLNDSPVILLSNIDIAASSSTHSNLALTEHFTPTVASSLLFFRIQMGGSHTISAKYVGNCQSHGSTTGATNKRPTDSKTEYTSAGIPHFPPFPVPRYPASVSVDNVSSGDGIFKYGSDGYILFGFQNGADLTSLPPYIKNVTVRHHDYYGMFTCWCHMNSPVLLRTLFFGKSSHFSFSCFGLHRMEITEQNIRW